MGYQCGAEKNKTSEFKTSCPDTASIGVKMMGNRSIIGKCGKGNLKPKREVKLTEVERAARAKNTRQSVHLKIPEVR